MSASPLRPRKTLLLASSGLTILAFLLDSLLPQSRALRANTELFFYALGLCVALFYVQWARKGRQPRNLERDASYGEVCQSMMTLAAENVAAVRAEAAKVYKKVRGLASWIRFKAADALCIFREQVFNILVRIGTQLSPPIPRPLDARPEQEVKLVPLWAVTTMFWALTSMSMALLVSAFKADMSGNADPTVNPSMLDPVQRLCNPGEQHGGITLRSSVWFVVTFWLSSGLCAVHPLQSGLILGF